MSAQKASDRQLRTEQQAQIGEAIATLEARLQQCRQNQRKQLTLLDSVSLGLYTEIDKLAKKAPAEPVTDLALEQINDVIRETKQLVESDPYIQRLNEFVAAGDNPQHRDAVIVLRQIRQGLERFRIELDSLIELLSNRLKDAKHIQVAIQLYLTGVSPDKDVLQEYGVYIASEWVSRTYPHSFNFTRLDRTNIREYFAEVRLP
jgi:malonyl CoA-acyl carrier protein transacylase